MAQSSRAQTTTGEYGPYPTVFDVKGLLGYDQEEVEGLAQVDPNDRVENLATVLVGQHPDLDWSTSLRMLGALAQLDRARMTVIDELALVDFCARVLHPSDLTVEQDL